MSLAIDRKNIVPDASINSSARMLFEAHEREQTIALRVGRRRAMAAGLDPLARDEYANCGLIGLFDACRRFDPAKGYKFSTFIYGRINGEISDTMRNEDHLTRGQRSAKKEGEFFGDKVSLDQEISGRDEGSRYEAFRDARSICPARQLEARDLLEKVIEAVPVRGRMREAFVLYFIEGVTMIEIAKRLRRSESRICQIIKFARSYVSKFSAV